MTPPGKREKLEQQSDDKNRGGYRNQHGKVIMGAGGKKKKSREKHSGEINKDVTIGLFPVCVTCQRASLATR